MSRSLTEYQCLLISPGDVTQERDAVSEVVAHWNGQIGKALGCRVELVKWETHETPDASDEPQKILNGQFVDTCDLGIAAFWARIGSSTTTHPSGSAEEID